MNESIWSRHSLQDKVCEALSDVTIVNPAGHHFGRPYMTAYQLAIKLDHAHPEVRQALGLEVGGAGTGSHNSLAQYLAGQLSQRINRQGTDFPVEGAFLSNDHVTSLTYVGPEGEQRTSSLTGTNFNLSLFRLRALSVDHETAPSTS